MKKLILLFFISNVAFSQGFRINDTKEANFYVIVDPNASIKENGLNIGIGIEHMEKVYVGASVTNFAVLKDGYTEVIGSFGVPFTSGHFSKTKYYIGLRAGYIFRKATYPTAGLEAGINQKITEKISIGVKITYIYRSDFEFYDFPNEFRPSGFGVLIFKLN